MRLSLFLYRNVVRCTKLAVLGSLALTRWRSGVLIISQRD